MKRVYCIASLLLILLLLLSAVGILSGAAEVSPSAVLSDISSPEAYILLNMRVPRVLSALLAGGILSLSGLVFQSVFRNPMADSYLLGVSAGSSLAAVLASVLLPYALVALFLPYFAFSGAMLAALLIFLISKREPGSLILSGIAINLLLTSLTTLCIFISRRRTESVLFWSLGSFSAADWSSVAYLLSAFILILLVASLWAPSLDILLLDSGTASSLGIDVNSTRLALLVLASLATAVSVSLCGIIGFVGLMSPHLAKLIAGPKHRRTIPLSILFGSLIMLSSDLVSRTIAGPSELPVGIVTSILGVPLFILLLRRRNYR